MLLKAIKETILILSFPIIAMAIMFIIFMVLLYLGINGLACYIISSFIALFIMLTTAIYLDNYIE